MDLGCFIQLHPSAVQCNSFPMTCITGPQLLLTQVDGGAVVGVSLKSTNLQFKLCELTQILFGGGWMLVVVIVLTQTTFPIMQKIRVFCVITLT